MGRTFKTTALEIKMIRYWFNGLFVFILSTSSAFAESGAKTDTGRGSMLYDNHCIQCHTRQIHWREKNSVTDWESLIAQVDRWQHASGLLWSQADIEEVSRYLNSKYYHYP
jgi:mono/diheme cytochrome c family protein